MGFLFEKVRHAVNQDDQEVNLKIIIGDAQRLFRIVVNRVDGNTVYDQDSLSLGRGGELRGKATTLFVSVTDDNPVTDSTSVTLLLDNSVLEQTFSKDADTPNGTVDYYITIHHS
jgi:hypothetical protein